MRKSDYLSFFKLESVNFFNQGFFGLSHFFNRAKTGITTVNYDEVFHNSAGGRVLLGQLPVNGFNADLLSDLLPDGLIVSCNESYELSGFASVIDITKPHCWQEVGIEHLHLPFVDFTANVQPALLLNTLNKMLEVYQRGGAIYVHCKAGRSRSPLVVALFMSILDLIAAESSDDLAEWDLKNLLQKNITRLEKQRPQTKIEASKVVLGIQILESYDKDHFSATEIEEEEYTQSAEFFDQLTQAPQFKALWHFAYNNQQYLPEMQTIMTALYDNPLNILDVLKSTNWKQPYCSPLQKACHKIRRDEEGCLLLVGLEQFIDRHKTQGIQPVQTELNKAFKQFDQSLEQYKKYPTIIAIGREIESKILLAETFEQAKIDWLHKSTRFLNNPGKWAKSYYTDAKNLIFSKNPDQRALGELMFTVAAFVLVLILVFILALANAVTLPIALGVGVAALSFMAFGKTLTDPASAYEVEELSQQLASKVPPH